MPPGPEIYYCPDIRINFSDERCTYLGGIAWINLATGEYQVRIRDAGNRPVCLNGCHLFEDRKIEPDKLRIFLRGEKGENIAEVSMDYLKSLAVLLGNKSVEDGKILYHQSF